jgi:hypothetical protein
MRTILIIVLGLFIAQKINAQSDSLIIKLGDYGQMIVISPNLVTEKQKSFGLDTSYRNFYNDFKKIDKSKFSDKNQVIKYTYKRFEPQYQTITIEKADIDEDVYYFNEDKQQSIQGNKYKLELMAARKVIILVNSLEDFEKINQLSLDSLYLQSLEHIKTQNLHKRVPYKIFYDTENMQINKNSNFTIGGKLQDFIVLDAEFGMSVMDSRVAPEWGANLEFMLKKKDYPGLRFGINYTTMYLYDKNNMYNISSYGFLNLSYYFENNEAFRFSHKLVVGYLVNKSGNDFNGNTWNAYLSSNINNLGFKIGGIYTKNLNGAYTFLPSIGINFGF